MVRGVDHSGQNKPIHSKAAKKSQSRLDIKSAAITQFVFVRAPHPLSAEGSSLKKRVTVGHPSSTNTRVADTFKVTIVGKKSKKH